MGLSPEQVKKIAHLARLGLSKAEVEKFSSQLSAILNYIEALDRLDVTKIEPTAHAVSVPTPLRDDTSRPFAGRDDTLGMAPDHDGPFFKVPKVI